MTRSLLALLMGATGMSGLAQAQGLDNSWYLGGKAGWSHYFGADFEPGIARAFELVGADEQEDALGLGLFVGYQLNPNLGFELGYDHLGSYRLSGRQRQDGLSAGLTGEARAQLVQASMRIGYPVTPSLDLYGRLGGAYGWTESDVSAEITVDSSQFRDSANGNKYHGAAFVGALGGEYALNPSWALRLEYQYSTPLGNSSLDESGIELDNGLLALALVYRFGQGEDVQAEISPAPAPVPPATVIIRQRFSLSSDLLFAFNEANLRPEANQALDSLFQQIVAANPRDGVATVVGHTDRLGADDYNQRLSELRARAVADGLIARGWPADKVEVTGRGEQEPVTGNRCNGGSKRELIPCLAPDRRVDIQLDGVGEPPQP